MQDLKPTENPPLVLQYISEDRSSGIVMKTSLIIQRLGLAAAILALATTIVPVLLLDMRGEASWAALIVLGGITVTLWLCQWAVYLVWSMHALTIAERLGRDVPTPATSLLLHLIPIVHIAGPFLVFSHLAKAPPGAAEFDVPTFALQRSYRAGFLLWLAFWVLPVFAFHSPTFLIFWVPVAMGLPLANARIIRQATQSLTLSSPR